MAFAQKLVQRQSQSLVMTQQLSQSIKLLTMSNIELAGFIESELEKNPFLELEKPRTEREEAPIAASDRDAVERPELKFDNKLETNARELGEKLGTDIENAFPDDQSFQTDKSKVEPREDDFRISPGGLPTSTARTVEDVSVCELLPQRPTLSEHLHQQLAIAAASPQHHAVAAHLIDQLDEAGYLREDMHDIAGRLNVDHCDVETALHLVQSLEPAGVGATGLAECLALQLADRGRLDPAIQCVLDNLDLLAKRDFVALGQVSNLDLEDLTDILRELRELEPRPGTLFSDGTVEQVSPDVIVSEASDGTWKIELNNDTLPRVLINNTYVSQVGGKLGEQQDRDFVANCVQNANWLTRSLDQRAQTILKVTREIVKRQDEFLVDGVRGLKPLTLRMVADEIDMHESSVSRVTTGKYVLTPRGMFELKYFFTTAIASTDSEDLHSSEAVRDQIRRLIENETAKAVLSDDAIVTALESTGIKIARRTVAKYRDAMQIASSVQRRREKRAIEKVARQHEA